MVAYTFPSYPALDPTTETLVRGASGQVYDINDTAGSTPLSITDLNGLPLAEVKTTEQGITTPFRVEDKPEVIWRSGSYAIPLSAPKAMRDAAESSAQSAASSATDAAETAESVANLKQWVEQGITRRNLVTNPRLIGRTFGVAGGTGTQSDVLTGGPLGFGYRRLVMSATTTTSPITIAATGSGTAHTPVIEGRTYTFSAYAQMIGGSTSPATNSGISVNWFDAAGAGLSSDSTYQGALVNGVWTRHSKTLVAPAGAAYAQITERFSVAAGSVPVGSEYGATGFMVEESATLGEYADGSLATTPHRANRWSSTPNASVSEQLDMTQITEKLPPGGTMGQALVKVSSADRDVAWGTVAGGGGGTSIHGLLSGLDQDDHTQYLNNSRAEAKFYTKAQVDTIANNAASANSSADRARGNHTGTQAIATVAGLETRLANLEAGGGGGGSSAVISVAGRTGAVVIAPTDVVGTTVVGRNVMAASSEAAARGAIGLDAVNNTSDANKPLSSAALAANAERIPTLAASPVKPTGEWYGSQAQYDALGTKVSTVIYTILEGV